MACAHGISKRILGVCNSASLCCWLRLADLQPNMPDDYLGAYITGPDGEELQGAVQVGCRLQHSSTWLPVLYLEMQRIIHAL